MDPQRTLKRQISCAGIGLHSGQKVTLTLKPAAADTGIRFRRTDLGVEIPATVAEVSSVQHATVLGKAGATVETVEHLLAALVSAGIDNVIVELNHREVPIMDGSSAPFLYLLQEAGVKKLSPARRYLKILKPVQIASGDKRIAIYPSDHFKVSYTISFDHPLLRHQSRTERITEGSFADHIAAARTFGFLKEVEWLRQNGLALGGSLENAIVIGDTGVLNALRFEDEFVRHKILDVVGDLALVGYPIVGHVVAHRAGHALHTQLAAEILTDQEAWCLVEAPAAVPQGLARWSEPWCEGRRSKANISNAIRRMSEGELLQLERSYDPNITESLYYSVIEHKSAVLLSAACEAGSILGAPRGIIGPKAFLRAMRSMAARASTRFRHTMAPLPAARPSALMTTGASSSSWGKRVRM